MAMRTAAFIFAVILVLSGAGASESAPKIIKMAHVVSETHPVHAAMIDYIKNAIEEGTKGSIIVEIYPNGQLGGDRQAIEAVQLGTIQMTTTAAAVLSGFEPQFALLDFPFIFKDKPSAYRALDGELGRRLNALLPEKHGMRNLIIPENGLRHITNNRGPIRTPADLKGLKIRTMENPVHQAMFKMLGANPTPISYGELFTALQQGTVDAQETPIPLIYTSKFYEVQKYCSLTGHVFASSTMLINEDFWQSLTQEERDVIDKAMAVYLENERRINSEQEEILRDELVKSGMEVNDLTAEEKQAFMDATSTLLDQMSKELGLDPELVELVKRAND
jgi:tripartite ATP-independent transporter DctP family solute receptor